MSSTHRRKLEGEVAALSGLLAWERLFGPKLLSWTELAELGTGLTRAEAERYLRGEPVGEDRKRLYQEMFAHHRELQTFLALRDEWPRPGVPAPAGELLPPASVRRPRTAARSHFIARLGRDVEPEPSLEVGKFMERAKDSPAHQAWFPTKPPAGKRWKPVQGMPSVGLVFHRLRSGAGFEGFVGTVRQRRDSKPSGDRALDALYGDGTNFNNWWYFADPVRIRFDSLHQLPGTSAADGSSPQHSFYGMASFVFWDFNVPPSALRAFLSV
jgi:hypothetical protein